MLHALSSSDLSSVDFATTAAGGSKNLSSFESWRANITFPDDKNDDQMYYVYYVIPQPELVASLTKMRGMLEYIDFKIVYHAHGRTASPEEHDCLLVVY
jgi:hypothetical protein